MKRCMICGNTGEENSTVCGVCGGSFVETPEDTKAGADTGEDPAEQIAKQLENMLQYPASEEKNGSAEGIEQHLDNVFESEAMKIPAQQVSDLMPEQDAEEEDEDTTDEEPAEDPVSGADSEIPAQAAAQRQPHRMSGGPQIYGQIPAGDGPASYNGPQGMVRRNIQGRPMNAPQGQPVNMAPQGRPMNAPQGQPVNMAPQGRPMNAPQGQPMNMTPQGRYTKAVRDTARKAMKSPLFFLIALLNTVCLAGSVAAIFLKELNFSQFGRLISDMELPVQVLRYLDDFQKLMAYLDTEAVVVNLALHIPDLLFCLGLWLVFFCALGAREKMSGIGFSFMKLVVVLGMILSCIVMLAGLIITVTLVVAAWASGTKNMIISAVIAMVVMIVITMMVIMYYFCYLGTIRTCRMSAKTGETYGAASAYVALVQMVMALTAIVSLLSGIVNAEISNTAAAIGKMGWMILFGIWIFRYRGKMKKFAES